MTDLTPFLGGRSFEDWRSDYDRDGYIVLPSVLVDAELERLRGALKPYLDQNIQGRNNFEGVQTNRVYAMMAKDPAFVDLILHPLAMEFAEAELGKSMRLSACLAINLHPGETVQPWHYDDAHLEVPRPRAPFGVSAFWAIDDTTVENGATEVLPGSHTWGGDDVDTTIKKGEYIDTEFRPDTEDPGARPDAVKVTMPAGSLMLAKGTLWHRGGANKSDKPRLIITPQYCSGWARQLENMVLTMTWEQAAKLPVRAQELLGYSIHPPFMGYVDGTHPARVLNRQ